MDIKLAIRPPPGKLGAPYFAYTNLFVVKECPTKPIYHYDEIYPEVRNAHKARRIFEKLRTHIAPGIFTGACAFDGKKNAFAINIAPVNGTQTFEVNMSDVPLNPGETSRAVYRFTMTSVGVILPDDLKLVLEGRAPGVPVSTTAMQALNVLVSEAAALRFKVHTKNKFYIDRGVETIRGIEIWRGFFQALRPASKQLLVNVDMATGVMYQRGPLLDFIKNFFNVTNLRELARVNVGHEKYHSIRKVVKGLKIRLRHSGKIRFVKTIVSHAGDYEFHTNNGVTTVDEYFRDVKHHRILYPKYPGIITTRDEVIPFELCDIVEGQLFRKMLDNEITEKMLNAAKKRPADRFSIIKEGLKELAIQDSPFIAQAGMKVNSDPLMVTGRLLKPPSLQHGRQTCVDPRDGAWNTRTLVDPMKVGSWVVIILEPSLEEEDVVPFVTKLVYAMKDLGMVVFETRPRIIQKLNINGILTEMRAPPQFILVVIPDYGSGVRKEVKQFGDILQGVPTQCALSRHVLAAKSAYLKNLILKINVKIGGTNYNPYGPSIDWFNDGNSIVIGADVTHPAPGVARPSVAALVASMDGMATKYIARCSVQAPRLEIIEDLRNLMMYMLHNFYRYRAQICERIKVPLWPERIIFFRDGVSEGEIETVVNYEIAKLEEAVKDFCAAKNITTKPKVTFIVVGKRHHVRFLPKEPKTADKSGNCPAGFVVDSDLTCPGMWDFYLQSHQGLLGTSRPSHYIVIKDDNGFSSDRLQSFAFALCHVHARSMRSVSIPAPVYYAHIACARADIHFNPMLNYEDNASFDGTELDMQTWIKGFANVHSKLAMNMYFM